MSKTNPTKNHHYTPRCYLKSFVNEDSTVCFVNLDLYKKFQKYRIERKGLMGICFKENFYKKENIVKGIFPTLEEQDDLYIENEALTILENKYENLLGKLIGGGMLIDKEALDFSDFILLLKIRNTAWRKRDIKLLVKDAIDDLKIEYKSGNKYKLSDAKIDSIADQFFNYVISHSNLEKHFQLFSIMNRTNGDTSSLHVTFRIACLNWYILHPPLFSCFLTTDNPGFSVDYNHKVHDFKFVDDSRFYLPLTPKHCLMIDSSQIDDLYYRMGIKKIKEDFIGSEFLNRINTTLISRADEFVVSKIGATISRYEEFIKEKFR